MAEIKKSGGRDNIHYMARDYESLLRTMQDMIPEKLPEWKDYESDADFGNVMLQLFAHMGDIIGYYQDRIANESFLGTAVTRRSIIHHLRLIGYNLSTAAPASTRLRITVPKTCDDIITISDGDAFATKSQDDKPSVRFEYTGKEPLIIDCKDSDTFAEDPEYTTKKYYKPGFSVEEGRLVKDEILGLSNGAPNQRFMLARPGLILRSPGLGPKASTDIVLTTELGGVVEGWTLQESLVFSREVQKDFIVEIDEEDRATLIFGDGAMGAIPPGNAEIKVTYRVGGGAQGNVAKDTIQTIIDAPQLALLGAKVTNPEPATGGGERESMEHAVKHAPKVFRSLKRAVTSEDYRALALGFKGVGKVRAESANWNLVNLFVAPEGGGYVSDVLIANLLAYFEDKRPLSTIVKINDVVYVSIYVTAKIEVESYYSHAEIEEEVKEKAGSLLAFENVDFAETVYLSKFYEKIEDINGVRSVYISEFSSIKGELSTDGKIIIKANEIPRVPEGPEYKDGIKVEISGGMG